MAIFGSLNWQKLEESKKKKNICEIMRTHLKYTLWLLKWACTWGGWRKVNTLWPRSTAWQCQCWATTWNNRKLRASGDSWAQMSALCSDTRLAFPALQKWCGVSNQRRVIKICTNKPGKLHADSTRRGAKVCLLCVLFYKTKNNNNRGGSNSSRSAEQ